MESESFQALHRQQGSYIFKDQKGTKKIDKIVHVTSVVQL